MRFLVHFAHRHLPFRLPELDSVLQLHGVDPATAYDRAAAEAALEECPFLVLDLPSEATAVGVANRGILIKAVYELWADGEDYDLCVAALRSALLRAGITPRGDGQQSATAAAAAAAADLTTAEADAGTGVRCSAIRPEYFDERSTWSVNVGGFGRKYSMAKQQQIRARFSFVPFRGAVSLKAPDQRFWVMEEVGTSAEEQSAERAKRIFFLRTLATSARDLVGAQSLKQRRYLGPTSMDNELSLLMANQGMARRGARVLDPFVGTGSLLVSCSTFGAACAGWDIDTRVLQGMIKGKLTGRNVWSNFDQYGLPRPELMRCDVSLHRSGLRWPTVRRRVASAADGVGATGGDGHEVECALGVFDAIVTDPPYGIRAGARRAGSRRVVVKEIPADMHEDHIPQTRPYAPEDVMADLLALAARALTVGGRLVYLLPSTYDYTEADLPRHPCLAVVANSEQPLTLKYARRLITMEKTCEYVMSEEQAYDAQAADSRKATAASYANMLAKIKAMNAAERSEALPLQGKRAKRMRWQKQGKKRQLPPPELGKPEHKKAGGGSGGGEVDGDGGEAF
eukprot:g5527.t1